KALRAPYAWRGSPASCASLLLAPADVGGRERGPGEIHPTQLGQSHQSIRDQSLAVAQVRLPQLRRSRPVTNRDRIGDLQVSRLEPLRNIEAADTDIQDPQGQVLQMSDGRGKARVTATCCDQQVEFTIGLKEIDQLAVIGEFVAALSELAQSLQLRGGEPEL